jgi:hypothetical protein
VFVSNNHLSFHPWTPNCYRPITTTAHIATTRASIDVPPSRVASLLVTSKGLPPPLFPSCDCDFGEEVVSLEAVDVFFEVVWVVVEVEVVAGAPPPRPPSADSTDCDVVEVEVVFAARLVVVAVVDCAIGIEVEVVEVVEVLKPRPPVTPGPSVGIVTETAAGAAGVELAIVTEVVDFGACVVVFSNVGHKASTIPPSLTIPNNVFELTCTFEQALDTLLAIEFSPDTQDAEHPLLKSETVQEGIWLSYVN